MLTIIPHQAALKEKTLVEKIFSKVNEDLKASGLEPIN
jgi:hypothetical protein